MTFAVAVKGWLAVAVGLCVDVVGLCESRCVVIVVVFAVVVCVECGRSTRIRRGRV